MDEQWGKYRLLRRIGAGGMAEVFEADMLGPAKFAKRVCLKRMLPTLSNNSNFVKMFQTEARIVSILNHPNIVTLLDFDEHDEQHFLVMELVDGPDLRHILEKANRLGLRLPLGFAVAVADGLLAALDHAHTRTLDGNATPVVHRDVSPHNVLVSNEGQIKLTDFGIAKASGLSENTAIGILKGKLFYFSPELVEGGAAGTSSDLFGAGLVFYEMLTGRRVFSKNGEQSVPVQIATYQYTPIPWLSDSLNEVLAGLLQREPEKRFPTAEMARAELLKAGTAPFTDMEVKHFLKALQSAYVPPAASSESEPSESPAPEPSESPAPESVPQPSPEASLPGRTPSPRVPQDAEGDYVSTRRQPTPSPSEAPSASGSVSPSASGLVSPSASGSVAPSKEAAFGRRARMGLVAVSALVLLAGTAWIVARPGGSNAASEVPAEVPVTPAPAPTPRMADPAPPPPSPVMPPEAASGTVPEASLSKSPARRTPKVVRLEPGPGSKAEPADRAEKEDKPGAEKEDAASSPGFVDINVRPWANVTIDGKERGSTPLKRVPLKPGKHVVVIENGDLAFRETVRVNVRAGKTTAIKRVAQQTE